MTHFTCRIRDGMGRWTLEHIFATDLNAAFENAQRRFDSFRDLNQERPFYQSDAPFDHVFFELV